MLVHNITIPEGHIVILIKDIKRKKELAALSFEFVREHLFEYLQQQPKTAHHLAESINQRSAQHKRIIKEMRAFLRRVYGLYREEEDAKRRRALLQQLPKVAKLKQKEQVIEILKTHSSTRERLPHYSELYQKIFAITEKPRIILDLGAGINPFSIPLMKLRSLEYYAYDISETEITALNRFFQHLHQENPSFHGKAEVLDILHFATLPDADVAFLFKMTDVLDRGKGHKMTEKVLLWLPVKYVVISFATKTMSGKRMTAPGRRWMEWLCDRLGYKYHVLSFPNELFYVIKKGK